MADPSVPTVSCHDGRINCTSFLRHAATLLMALALSHRPDTRRHTHLSIQHLSQRGKISLPRSALSICLSVCQSVFSSSPDKHSLDSPSFKHLAVLTDTQTNSGAKDHCVGASATGQSSAKFLSRHTKVDSKFEQLCQLMDSNAPTPVL